ncbi:MAG: hypothetical protein KDA92_24435, partial [Planctomycetales bacterium]|nr:hypothetical protein [Planctomycetales bacterium]
AGGLLQAHELPRLGAIRADEVRATAIAAQETLITQGPSAAGCAGAATRRNRAANLPRTEHLRDAGIDRDRPDNGDQNQHTNQ